MNIKENLLSVLDRYRHKRTPADNAMAGNRMLRNMAICAVIGMSFLPLFWVATRFVPALSLQAVVDTIGFETITGLIGAGLAYIVFLNDERVRLAQPDFFPMSKDVFPDIPWHDPWDAPYRWTDDLVPWPEESSPVPLMGVTSEETSMQAGPTIPFGG